MGQKKLLRFAQIKEFSNVLEYPKDVAGTWNNIFNNNHPIVLELACGRGEYAVGLGEMFPENNFIGVDIKGNRMYLGAKKALDKQLNNIRFLRTQIEMLPDYFGKDEVDEIWITFPDPRLRDRDEKRRLTFHTFLNRYKKILKPGGIIHLKTDSLPFFEFSEESLAANGWETIVKTNDLYNSEWNEDHYGIKTRFEQMFHEKGFSINYLRAKNLK